MTNWNPVAALTADEITVATFAWSVAACALLGERYGVVAA